MKNFLMLGLSIFIFQSSVALEIKTPEVIIAAPYGDNVPAEPQPGVSAPIDIEALKTFTPDKPRKLTETELTKMFKEMKAMNRLARADFAKVLPRVKYIQYSFEFTVAPGVKRTRELRTYLIFSYRAIQVDPSNESKQYFHNAYDIYKADFNRIMSTLSPAQRANLYKADDEAKRLQENPVQDDEE